MDCFIDRSSKKRNQYPILLSALMLKSKEKPDVDRSIRYSQNLSLKTPQNKPVNLESISKTDHPILKTFNSSEKLISSPSSALIHSFTLSSFNNSSILPNYPIVSNEILALFPNLPE